MNTPHLSQDELVLCYYSLEQGGELVQAQRHLAACEHCRQELAVLASTMNLLDEWAIPERDDAYGARVWRALEPRISNRREQSTPAGVFWQRWFSWRSVALAGALAGLMAISFLAGRRFPGGIAPQTAETAQTRVEAEKRMLLFTLNDHLEASQRMLTEVSNEGSSDLAPGRESAAQLVAANRLYRQAAGKSGDRGMALLLEDLERYLQEAAHASPAELTSLQQRLKEDDILFQLRVLNNRLQQQRRLLPVVSN